MARGSASVARAKTAQAAKGITHLQSLNVIRNMIRVSVSEICYLRNLFPEELFKERVYADMHIKCLAPTKDMVSKDAKDALTITQWLEDGVFEALKKKYLSSVALCVYAISADHEPAQLLESYTYTIKHGNNGSQELSTSFTGASPLDCTPQHVKAQAIQLIRSLVSITNNLDPLPTNRLITMKVHFNENCPESWQPQHFMKSSVCYGEHNKDSSLKLAVGRVVTPHHLVSMEIETAEECLESLSQAKPRVQGSQSHTSSNEDANGVVTDDENLTPTEEDDCERLEDVETEVEKIPSAVISTKRTSDVQNDAGIGREDFVRFVILSEMIDKQSIERRFPNCSSAQIIKWLDELVVSGVLRKTTKTNHYAVAVHDTDTFYGAINETHGKMKRKITVNELKAALDIHPALSEALLLRMEEEKLIRRDGDSPSFGVHFSECNRALVRKAIQHAKERDHENSTADNAFTRQDNIVDNSSPDVYDFEPSAFITPRARSKRKAQDTSTSNNSSSTKTSCSSRTSAQGASTAVPRAAAAAPAGGCANEPIVQVKKALKKRKLALKTIG